MLGIALEGGGARCAAQAGALAALADKQAAPDLIAGCGCGAWVAALFAMGARSEGLRSAVRDIKQAGDWMLRQRGAGWRLFARGRIDGQGILPMRRVEKALRWQTLDTKLTDVSMPLAIPTWDVESGEEQLLSSRLPDKPSSMAWNRQATLAQAVRAAMTAPGFCEPVVWRGRLLTGGMSHWATLPDALRDLGADRILRVRVVTLKDAGLDPLTMAACSRLPRGEEDDGVLNIKLPAGSRLLDCSNMELFFDIGYRTALAARPIVVKPSSAKPGGKVLPFERSK
ncbi:MAG: patatin-like phospholipase family protein [Oscillospiraceae bacterium]|nr:patatin-like phospholipase family protein [Oscillospiraceae bacterium]